MYAEIITVVIHIQFEDETVGSELLQDIVPIYLQRR